MVSLIDQIGGVMDTCAYDVTFTAQSDNLVLQPPATDEAHVAKSASDASAAYDSVFSPKVTVNLPRGASGFSGKEFEVRYTLPEMPMEGCSGYDAMGNHEDSGMETYTINSSGSAEPEVNAKLVDSTAGSSVRCVYNAKFDDVIASGTYGYSASNSNTVSATEPLDVRYHNMSFIYPIITVRVANINKNGDNIHDFAGTKIKIIFTRTSENEFCSVGSDMSDDITEIITIQNSGNDSIVNSNVQLAAGQPRGRTTCSYSIKYDIEYSENTSERLAMQPGYTTSVNAASLEVNAVFSAGFVPDVNISVPKLNVSNGVTNKFSGTELPVTFTHNNGSQSQCSNPVMVSYTVQERGGVTTDEDFVLVDNTPGNGSDTITCTYTATFESVVGRLHLSTGRPFDSISAGSRTTVAYDAKFEPKIEIGFPLPVTGSADDTNELFRSRIWFNSDQESCGNNISQRFKVLGSGKIEFIGDALKLLDGNSEATSSCSYSVTVSESLEGGSYVTGTTSPGNVSATTTEPLIVLYTSTFNPRVSFSISGTGSGSQNNFIDDEIFAIFEASGNLNSGCSNRATVAYIVESTEAAPPEGDLPSLVGSIPVYVVPSEGGSKGSFNTVRCEYSVSFSFPQDKLTYNGEPLTVSDASPTGTVLLSVVSE